MNIHMIIYKEDSVHYRNNIYTAIEYTTQLIKQKITWLKANDDAHISQYINNMTEAEQLSILQYIIIRDLELFKRVTNQIENFDIKMNGDLLFTTAINKYPCENFETIKYLIDMGLTVPDDFIIKHNPTNEVLELIIKHGADINANNGQPLINAIQCQSQKNFQTLINNGADTTLIDINVIILSKILSIKCSSGINFFILYLLDNDPNIYLHYDTLLINYVTKYYVSNSPDISIIKLLLSNGANINCLSETNLKNIIAYRYTEVIQLLLAYNVDFSILNQEIKPYADIILLFEKNNIELTKISQIVYDYTLDFGHENNDYFDFNQNDIINKYRKYIYFKELALVKIQFENNDTESWDFIDPPNQMINYWQNILKLLIDAHDLDFFKQVIQILRNFDIKFDDDILLAVAMIVDYYDAVVYFMERGLNKNAVEWCVVHNINGDILQYLIDIGYDCSDNKFLINAMFANMYECTKILLGNNMDTETIINCTRKNIDIRILKYFIDLGTDMDILLRYAIYFGSIGKVKLLLELGADVRNIQMSDLCHVVKFKNYNLINLLFEYNVDFTILNSFEPSIETNNLIHGLLNAGLTDIALLNIIY